MTRKQLLKKVRQRTDIPKKSSKIVVYAIWDAIESALEKSDRVSIELPSGSFLIASRDK